MNQTGVVDVGSPRAARSSDDSWTAGGVAGAAAAPVRGLGTMTTHRRMQAPTRRGAYAKPSPARGTVAGGTSEEGEDAMFTTSLTWRHCAICGQHEAFEVPPCVDGHGADCPDLVCVGCGALVTAVTRDTATTPATERTVHVAA
jgi:hypothetical protein